MKDDFKMVLVLMGVACLFGLVLGSAIGKTAGASILRNEAVKAGVAEWRSDETGAAMFAWRKAQ